MFKSRKGEKIKVRILNAPSLTEQSKKAEKEDQFQKTELDNFIKDNLNEPLGQQNFSQKKSRKFRKLLFFLIFFLILILGATLAGFFIFGGRKLAQASVDLKIQAPFEISSGEEIEYLIEIKNKEAVALKQVDLLLKYPFGFEYLSSSGQPVNETKNSFSLPDIAANESYKLSVKGRLVGEINEQKNIEAILNYIPENFNSNFQVKKTAVSLIKDLIISLTFEYPELILQNQSFEIKIKYQNNSPEIQRNLRLVFEPAESLIIESESNATTSEEWFWDKELLTPGQQEEILIKAHFEKPVEKPKIEAKVGFVENESFKIITYKKAELQVISPEVELKLTVNDQENLVTVNWGEELNYKIKIKNNSHDFKISQAILKLKLNTNLVDKNSLKEDNGAVWTEDGLIWNEQSKIWEDFLKELAPAAEKEVNLSLTTINQPINLESYSASQLQISAQAQITSSPLGENFIIKSNEIITNVGNLVQFSAKAFYYLNENIQVGNGPIPPKVGETTTYKIYWYLNGGNSNLENMTIQAILPPDINWQGNFQVSAGDLTFDEVSRQINWTLPELLIGDFAQANFFISLMPTNSQVGQVVTLLNPSTLTCQTDNQAYSQTVNLLDTNLEFDPVKKGEGVVEP